MSPAASASESSFTNRSMSETSAKAESSGYATGLSVPPSYRSNRSPSNSLASVKRRAMLLGRQLLQLIVGEKVRVHRTEFGAGALLQLNDRRARALSDPVDLHDRVDVLEHGDAFLVRSRDDDLQAKLLVEAHHLTLVLAVHLGKRLVENRKRHSRRPPVLRAPAAVNRCERGADRDIDRDLLFGTRAGAATGFPPCGPARHDILHMDLEGEKVPVVLELAEILFRIFQQDLDLTQRIAVREIVGYFVAFEQHVERLGRGLSDLDDLQNGLELHQPRVVERVLLVMEGMIGQTAIH